MKWFGAISCKTLVSTGVSFWSKVWGPCPQSEVEGLLAPCPPGGGQSHSGGDTYVRLKRPPFSASLSPKDPYFFTIACALTQRPHDFLYFSLTECQISLTKCQICSPNAKFRSPNAPNPDFWPLSPHIFVFFCHRMPKIMLSPNDPSFFEPVLSPNAPACRSAGLTPVSISYLTAPPPGPAPTPILFRRLW